MQLYTKYDNMIDLAKNGSYVIDLIRKLNIKSKT